MIIVTNMCPHQRQRASCVQQHAKAVVVYCCVSLLSQLDMVYAVAGIKVAVCQLMLGTYQVCSYLVSGQAARN